MKLALLMGLFPENLYNEILENSKGPIQYAADALQKAFVDGLGQINNIDDIRILNLPYISPYPFGYNKCFLSSSNFQYSLGNGNYVQGDNIGFCNIDQISKFSRYIKTKSVLIKWCNEFPNEDKVVLVYAAHLPFIKACANVKKKYGDSLKIVLIVPDLPVHTQNNKSFLYKVVHSFINKQNDKYFSSIDGFVLLSKYMADFLSLKKRNWTVVEGIFNNFKDDISYNSIKKLGGRKFVFYSGTMDKRYGVLNLVRAFILLPNRDYNLILCGMGDATDEIQKLAKEDNRIKYLGQKPRSKVLELQHQATLLVNPRTPEGEFTKYSFPSKTMEYLASGVPTLLYKLPGIPDEYYKYCYTIDELGIEVLSRRIGEILKIDDSELQKIGESARTFILENKTPIPQCEKVMKLINLL